MPLPRATSRRQILSEWYQRRHPRPATAWALELENGTDIGLFGPGSAVWAVNGGTATLVAGIRALLLQTLHPGAMAGVHDHSRYQRDPMGRLDGTARWVMTTSFGDTEAAYAGSRWVSGLHQRVTGTYTDASGTDRAYTANDPELLRWVHCGFTEAFLGAHRIWGGEIPGGADAYVREWAKSGELLGVQNAPTSESELREQMAIFAADFKPDERVAETVRFLRRPPVPREIRFAYRILFAGASASLPREYRRLLGLRRPWWPAITATRLLFALFRLLIGEMSPSEKAARRRVDRLNEPVARV